MPKTINGKVDPIGNEACGVAVAALPGSDHHQPALYGRLWRLEDMERRISTDLPYALAVVEAFSFAEWEK